MIKNSHREQARNALMVALLVIGFWVLIRLAYVAYYSEALRPSELLFSHNLGAIDGLLFVGLFLLIMSAVDYYRYKKYKNRKRITKKQ